MVNEKNNNVTIIGLFHKIDCNNTGGFHWVSCQASRGFLWGSCNWDIHTIMFALRAKYLSGNDARCNQYSIRCLFLLSFRSLAAKVSEKSNVFTFSHRKA